MHIAKSLELVVRRLRSLDDAEGRTQWRNPMSSTRVAINRVVITGRAVTEPVTRNVKSITARPP